MVQTIGKPKKIEAILFLNNWKTKLQNVQYSKVFSILSSHRTVVLKNVWSRSCSLSGHSVTVWNRTAEKCKEFVKAGAKEALTPGDVIAESDITFSCVSDPQAAKDMVFGNCGVLSEITTVKGYVEMTGIDADTSQDIAEAINLKGGRYIEAQVQGSKDEANDGTLVVLAAGDR